MAVPCSRENAKWGERYQVDWTLQVLLAGTACMVLAFAGCGEDPLAPSSGASSAASSGGSASSGYDSPKAVFDAAKQAASDEDWGKVLDAYTPDSQDRLVGSIAYGAAVLPSEEAKAVLRRHGIDDSMMPEKPSMTDMAQLQTMVNEMEEKQGELAAKIDDRRAFFAEMIAVLGDADSGGAMGAQMAASKKAQANAKLTDVEIIGDTAMGYQEFVINGSPRKVPVLFTRIDGSWYLRQPNREEMQELQSKMLE
jgi:hypothetical protein